MNRLALICLLALACGVLMICSSAHAGGIPVANAGFEDPIIPVDDDYVWLTDMGPLGWGWTGEDYLGI